MSVIVASSPLGSAHQPSYGEGVGEYDKDGVALGDGEPDGDGLSDVAAANSASTRIEKIPESIISHFLASRRELEIEKILACGCHAAVIIFNEVSLVFGFTNGGERALASK